MSPEFRKPGLENDTTGEPPLDAGTVRKEFERLCRQYKGKELVSLLTRYLAQPLSDSETVWANKNLANAYAVGEYAAEAVAAHEAFERWLPGKSPRLSFQFPHYPAPDDSLEETMGPDEIRVGFLAQSVQFATSYGAIGRYEDFVAKADAALAGLTPTPYNLRVRFFGLLIFMTASQVAGDFERAERRILEMHTVANQAEDAAKAATLHALAVTYEIQLARAQNDTSRVQGKLDEALSLLVGLEKNSAEIDLRGYRFELSHHLIGTGRHDAALPLLERNLAAGGHGDHGYGWLMHAAAVWRVERDRSRTLALLCKAPREYDTRKLADDFRGTPGFDDVADDPEFLQAVSRPA